MKDIVRKLSSVVAVAFLTACTTPSSVKQVKIRVAAYNVEFGKSATAEEFGKMLKPYDLDIIGFNEAPDGDWTERVGKVLGMKYTFVGKVSSANHKDKYKTILSKTPFKMKEEIVFKKAKRSWNPSSTVRVVTTVKSEEVSFYSLHICASEKAGGHAHDLATRVLPEDKSKNIIVLGDFNNRIGDDALKNLEENGMVSTWSFLNVDLSQEFTWNALNPRKQEGVIDHIFYNKSSGIKTTDGGIIELSKPLSDHKPVWAELEITK